METNSIVVTVVTNFWHTPTFEPPKKGEVELSGTIKIELNNDQYLIDWEILYGEEDSVRLIKDINFVFNPQNESDELGGWLIAHFTNSAQSPRDQNKIMSNYRSKQESWCSLKMFWKEAIVRFLALVDDSRLAAITNFCKKYGTKLEPQNVKSERLACGPYCETHSGAWPSDSIPDDNAKRQVHIDTCEEHGIENCRSCHQ